MKEIELKILDISPTDIGKKLCSLGAKKSNPLLVTDCFFELAGNTLYKQGKILRLRKQGDTNVLTLKMKGTKDSTFSVWEEFETEIENGDSIKKIFEMLGFIFPCYTEKKRTSFILETVRCEIDEYPDIPPYLEIEGAEKDIVSLVSKLGFSLKDTTNKRAFVILREYGLNPKHISF